MNCEICNRKICSKSINGCSISKCKACGHETLNGIEKSLDELLQPGKKIRVFYNEGNINNQIRHIRAVVDGEYIVYRVWSRRRQDWRYHVEHRDDFGYKYERGVLKNA